MKLNRRNLIRAAAVAPAIVAGAMVHPGWYRGATATPGLVDAMVYAADPVPDVAPVGVRCPWPCEKCDAIYGPGSDLIDLTPASLLDGVPSGWFCYECELPKIPGLGDGRRLGINHLASRFMDRGGAAWNWDFHHTVFLDGEQVHWAFEAFVGDPGWVIKADGKLWPCQDCPSRGCYGFLVEYVEGVVTATNDIPADLRAVLEPAILRGEL